MLCVEWPHPHISSGISTVSPSKSASCDDMCECQHFLPPQMRQEPCSRIPRLKSSRPKYPTCSRTPHPGRWICMHGRWVTVARAQRCAFQCLHMNKWIHCVSTHHDNDGDHIPIVNKWTKQGDAHESTMQESPGLIDINALIDPSIPPSDARHISRIAQAWIHFEERLSNSPQTLSRCASWWWRSTARQAWSPCSQQLQKIKIACFWSSQLTRCKSKFEIC